MSPEECAAYQELADQVADADHHEVWDAFAKRMYEMVEDGEHADHFPFAGLCLTVNPERAADGLDGAVWPTYRQFGDDRTIRENPVAKRAEAYAVVPVSPTNRVETARDAVVDALERELES